MTTDSPQREGVASKPVSSQAVRVLLDYVSGLRSVIDSGEQVDWLNEFEGAIRYFQSHRRQLTREYAGKYVAILAGAVVDSDADDLRLAERVHARFGDRPLFMPRAGRGADRPARMGGPRAVTKSEPSVTTGTSPLLVCAFCRGDAHQEVGDRLIAEQIWLRFAKFGIERITIEQWPDQIHVTIDADATASVGDRVDAVMHLLLKALAGHLSRSTMKIVTVHLWGPRTPPLTIGISRPREAADSRTLWVGGLKWPGPKEPPERTSGDRPLAAAEATEPESSPPASEGITLRTSGR